MKGEFFADNLFIYIEKEIIRNFSSGPIIDEFNNIKEQMTIIIISLYSYGYTKLVFIIFALVTIIKYINFNCISLATPKILIKIRH